MESNMGRDIYTGTAIQTQKKLKYRDAADERQYMLSEDYEVYEKIGEPVGAVAFHYHDFYELIPDRGSGCPHAQRRFPPDR